MNPIQSLLMAARGHQGLPATISHAPAPQPAQGGGGGDTQLAKVAAAHIHDALAQTHDPTLQAEFSKMLAQLTKYIANDQKEQHQAMAGKLSPRLMAQQSGR
jgi:hypothetical protein